MAGERILVVDDEPGVRAALDAILTDEGFVVQCVGSGEEGVEALDRQEFDAVLLDVWLPGMDGLETLDKIRQRRAETEVVMISGHGTIETAVRATKLGAFDFVEKPLSLEKTLLVLRNALRQRRLELANQRLLAQLARDTEIVGRSPAADRLRSQVEVATASDAPVLICGPNGSGREVVARRIHGSSSRADGPFVEVPCAALTLTAAELALYGAPEHPGRIRLAFGGTLYLEDVDRLPAEAQRRLAAALDAALAEPRAPRLLASVRPTAAPLDGELAQCLDVIRIEVPSLRERREDIPLLAERFMRGLAREYGRRPRPLTEDCLAALQSHDWPGEARELRNLIERLLLFAAGDEVRAADLPEELGGARAASEDLYGTFTSLASGLQAFERYFVRRVMAETAGDLQVAAERLGWTRERLEERLREL